MEKILDEQNLVLLYAVPWPPQGLYFKKEVNSVADMKGIKFRSYNSATARLAELSGMLPVQIEAAEISQAFATGVAESMISSGATGYDRKVWESLTHFYEVDGWLPRNHVFVNKDTWNGVSDASKNVIRACAAMIDRSVQALRRDANEIVLRVSTTFAVRRLIPALDRFRRLYPDARVRIETDIDIDVPLGPHADAAICYRRPSNPNREGELLISDRSIPVLAPSLLARSGYQSRADVTSIPALQCTADNWDWMYWAEQTGVDFKSLRFENAFDNDDAALHAICPSIFQERNFR